MAKKIDRKHYRELAISVPTVRPICPVCRDDSKLRSNGVHGRTEYLVCDGCEVRFKASIGYSDPDPKFFQHASAGRNAETTSEVYTCLDIKVK